LGNDNGERVKTLDYILSQQAREQLARFGRAQIQEEWILLALTDPDYGDQDPRTSARRVWKRIPEYGNRALRVVYNSDKQPPVIITVFFDRSYKG